MTHRGKINNRNVCSSPENGPTVGKEKTGHRGKKVKIGHSLNLTKCSQQDLTYL
jgi:hypothetical protein